MAFTYLVVDLFSVALLLIIYMSVRRQSPGIIENRVFCAIILATVGILLGEMLSWQYTGKAGSFGSGMLWISTILCFVLSGVISLGWVYYVSVKMDKAKRVPNFAWALISLPCLIQTIMSLTTPVTHWMFYVDGSNEYQRGELFYIQLIVPFGYLIAAAVWTGISAGRERLRQQRTEYIYLTLFIVFPLLGGLIQILVYGLSLAWPCTALSLLLVYVNLQNQRISVDALTGLSNRGQLDKYLYSCMSRSDNNELFALYILDIDDFKRINDKYGHTAGDGALVNASEILKRSLVKYNAFLSRYGGDEFAIVLHYTNEHQVYELIGDIERESAVFNRENGEHSYKLVFSVGYVCNDSHRFSEYLDMITAADARMYLQKQQHKATRK